mgnify:FL=1|jgi:predicted transcriptional regulator
MESEKNNEITIEQKKYEEASNDDIKTEVLVGNKTEEALETDKNKDLISLISKMEEITKQMPLNSIITNEEDTKSMKIVTDDTFLEVKKEIGESYERITITKSTKPKSIEERRIDVKDLRDKGETQEEVADILKVSQGTVSRDEKKIEEEKKNTN